MISEIIKKVSGKIEKVDVYIGNLNISLEVYTLFILFFTNEVMKRLKNHTIESAAEHEAK